MGWLFGSAIRTTMVEPERALAGRDRYAYTVPETHVVLGTPLQGPWPEGTAVIHLALGCFWGAEKELWQLPGVVTTAVGYQGGFTPFPTYDEVCTSMTGHTETVLVAYDPTVLPHDELLRHFWEAHDPTQGFRQGNDVGTQYRSAVFTTTPEQAQAAHATRELFAPRLARAGFGDITTEIRPADEAGPFYYAEPSHQQYLVKNPHGYCPVHSTGVTCD
ncbi:peptide-methionine (S)-S-oxide reductase MsrA [Cellulomonas palmilytica]|uniref:peptide-methionine (S)-S-oxide reductase MsrA n=1 Tax=Cellulomonas palmilytica TaxID=2608402 RepID=UPI001F442115|nr:peptide-methionine (S)-S-oxide reductase MsrA [Cellulomonas palmilytica]UJP41174.1 peptide-methionine (S)-S-oxide reductase MsrA [Cellulomonas palmilytica]